MLVILARTGSLVELDSLNIGMPQKYVLSVINYLNISNTLTFTVCYFYERYKLNKKLSH